MGDHELLIRHARSWASEKSRTLDEGILADVLELRDRYDDLPYGNWPEGSAERLLLVTWPAYGPPPADGELFRDTLDTFWGFLRATGRMAAASATPAALRKEAKRALPKMAAAYDDPARHSQGRVLGDFGRSIGVDLDDAADLEEMQGRLDRITEAWNDLPQEERVRRMPDPSPKGNLGQDLTSHLQASTPGRGDLPPWPEPDPDVDEEDLAIEPGEVATSARLARESTFVHDCLALAAWVGEGREVTAAGLLRPAVAREAYQHVDLWQWEREHDALRRSAYGAPDLPVDPEVDAVLADTALRSWRSAGDCLALDRLWYAVESANLVDLGSTKAVRSRRDPTSDEEWRDLALVLIVALLMRLGEYTMEPLAGLLLIAAVGDGPVPRDAVRAWWDSRRPDQLRHVDLGWEARLDQVWFHLDGCGLWHLQDDHYELTDLGRDLTILYLSLADEDLFSD